MKLKHGAPSVFDILIQEACNYDGNQGVIPTGNKHQR